MNDVKKERNFRLASYVLEHKGAFAVGFASMTLNAVAQLAGPLILMAVVDRAVPARDTGMMVAYGLAYVALVIAMGALTWVQTVVVARMGLSVVTRIKLELFDHLLRLPVAFFDGHPVGELMARVESDSEKVKELFSRTIVTLLSNAFFLVGMIVFFFLKSPRVALFVALPIPFLVAAIIFVFDRLRHFFEKARKLYAGICASITEYIQGIEVIRVFGRKAWALAKVENPSRGKRDAEVSGELIAYSFEGFLGFLLGPVFIVLVVKVTAPGIFAGTLTVGALLVFIEYGRRLFEPLFALGENVRQIQQARVALGRIFGLFDLAREHPGSGIPACFEREIEFRRVGFEYKEGEPVLADISFTVGKGQTVALVGPSGSGKTTTVGLLCAFYRPTHGNILVDGVPLADIDLVSWRKKIGLVLQDIYLFPGDVLENVRVYDDSVPETAVVDALSVAHARDFVDRLPEGIRTDLHERGSNLSLGEKQLLSFARAVAFNPEIVVLDEATSSVDVATEKRIKESMATLLEGRTALIVAHRLSSALEADSIIFFREGRIVARGTHEELFSGFPEYAELVRLQFPEFKPAETTGEEAS
ncbi:MAG: ABC transporter ATP-binding protein [Spirochaetes bacterium]|nr:ABC transporter ATP-binding protein [Spirochaetota bacterium]